MTTYLLSKLMGSCDYLSYTIEIHIKTHGHYLFLCSWCYGRLFILQVHYLIHDMIIGSYLEPRSITYIILKKPWKSLFKNSKWYLSSILKQLSLCQIPSFCYLTNHYLKTYYKYLSKPKIHWIFTNNKNPWAMRTKNPWQCVSMLPIL